MRRLNRLVRTALAYGYQSGAMGGLAWLMLMPVAALAQDVHSVDTAPNDQFSDRVTIPSGTERLFGHLDAIDPSAYTYTAEATLKQGEVNTLTISGLTPSANFLIFLAVNSGQLETTLGLFDDADRLVTTGYGGYYTSPLEPVIRGIVPPDGIVRIKVSGGSDEDFDGLEEYYQYSDYCETDICPETYVSAPHTYAGSYTLSVLEGVNTVPADIDFFTLTELPAGHVFTVSQSVISRYGMRIGWLADDGTVIQASSFSEIHDREQVSGIVPANGEVHLVVSGYEDFSFIGQHLASEDYLLQVETRAIASP